MSKYFLILFIYFFRDLTLWELFKKNVGIVIFLKLFCKRYFKRISLEQNNRYSSKSIDRRRPINF